METIGEQKIWTFLSGRREVLPARCSEIRRRKAYPVKSYMDLATKIAELQFRNRDFVLMFRGQRFNRRNRSGYTSLKPGLLRSKEGTVPSSAVLMRRFNLLADAERQLVQAYVGKKFLGRERLKRQQILRWSILQHYEVCPTPLLDVTNSLRIAASFASDGAEEEAYLFVLGIPNLSGAITASAEAGLQVVRLSSVCPPSALRPHIQEGYLIGEYPDLRGFDQKQHFEHRELDCGRRLVAKFRFNPAVFWKDTAFPMVSRRALYPDAKDPLYRLTEPIRRRLRSLLA
jgi:hypothetical protein